MSDTSCSDEQVKVAEDVPTEYLRSKSLKVLQLASVLSSCDRLHSKHSQRLSDFQAERVSVLIVPALGRLNREVWR